MNPTMFEIGVAILLVAVIVVLFVWLSRNMAAISEGRRVKMLARVGVDPQLARRCDNEAIMRDVRSRCGKCRAEDLCDRWLAGKVEGDNEFCPNAQIFRSLTGGRAAT